MKLEAKERLVSAAVDKEEVLKVVQDVFEQAMKEFKPTFKASGNGKQNWMTFKIQNEERGPTLDVEIIINSRGNVSFYNTKGLYTVAVGAVMCTALKKAKDAIDVAETNIRFFKALDKALAQLNKSGVKFVPMR